MKEKSDSLPSLVLLYVRGEKKKKKKRNGQPKKKKKYGPRYKKDEERLVDSNRPVGPLIY